MNAHMFKLTLYYFSKGGWILDNFPKTRDQWGIMLEKGLTPDDIINLRDESENGDYLVKRWYQLNRSEIDEKIQQRFEAEAEAKRLKEEEEKYEYLMLSCAYLIILIIGRKIGIQNILQ